MKGRNKFLLYPFGDRDRIAPTCVLSSVAPDPGAGIFSVTATFSEDVTGFVVGDITVTNGTAGNLAGSGAVYTFDVTPTFAGDVSVSIAAGVCTDMAGNLNLASNTFTVGAWLLLDRLVTDRAAGAINGTLSEPSGHGRTMTDSVPNAVITGGQYKVTAIAAIRNPWLRYASGITRAAGRALRASISANGVGADYFLVGLATTLTTPSTPQTLGVSFGGTVVVAQPANAQIAPYTTGTTITLVIIPRSTGHFTLIDNKLRHIYRSGTTATLYPHMTGLAADASCDLRVDNVGVADLPTTEPTLYPTPTLSDTFSDTAAPLITDGLAHIEAGSVNGAGLTWVGVGTFSNLGNKAYITPTPSADVVVNGAFAADTDWTKDAGWSIGSGVATKAASTNNIAAAVPPLVAGMFYRSSIDFAPTFNSFWLNYGGAIGAARSTTGTFVETARAIGTYLRVSSATTGTGTADNVVVQPIPFAQCLRTVPPTNAAEPYISVKLTITANMQAGLIINLDDSTTPQNCIHVWYSRIDSKVYARELVAGVWSADKLAGIAATYSAGAYLDVRRIGDEIYVWYNGAFVGTWTTTLTNANSKVALFATDASSYFESVTCYPTNGYDYGAYA